MNAASALRRFLALRPSERRIVLEAAVLAIPVEASLRRLGLRRTQRWLEIVISRLAHTEPATRSPAELEGLVAATIRWVPLRGECLQIALVQTTIERRRGHAVQFAIGVRRAGGAIEAHAWVEPLGAADENPRFRRITTWTP